MFSQVKSVLTSKVCCNSKLQNLGEDMTVITRIVKQFDSEYNLTSFK